MSPWACLISPLILHPWSGYKFPPEFVSLSGSLIPFYKVTSSDCQEGQSYNRKDYDQVPGRTSTGRVFHPVASQWLSVLGSRRTGTSQVSPQVRVKTAVDLLELMTLE